MCARSRAGDGENTLGDEVADHSNRGSNVETIVSWLVAVPILVVMFLGGCSNEPVTPSLDVSESMATETPHHTPTATARPVAIPSGTPVAVPPPITPRTAMSDRAALVALYEATDGPNWANSRNWLSDRPLGEWYGVTTDGDGRVTELDLSFNQLSGEVPAELGRLTNLKRLDISGNRLSGKIPHALGNLANLASLNLSHNQLSGCVREGLRNVPDNDLEQLGLPFCVAAVAGDRAALVVLYNATGDSNWVNNSNWLSDRPLGEWHGVSTDGDGRVTELRLEDNRLSGVIPAELGSLANLKRLNLYGNELSGPIPAELGSLSNLQWLLLFGNQLSGAIPAGLGSLSNLERLSLNVNQLSGEIPAELGSLSSLGWLNLSFNQLSGAIPPELASLSTLEGLALSDNQLSGTIPAELGSLSNLEILSISGNQLSGAIPAELGNLTNLQELWLRYNRLSGAIPAELGNLANLQELWLDVNQLSGAIPAELGNLTKLRDLYLSNNPTLSGPLPRSLTGLTSLTALWLHTTELCVATDDGFQAWFQGVDLKSGVVNCVGSDPAPTVDSPDRAALVVLYDATGGSNWANNRNWLSDMPIGEWYGVTTDGDGRVIGLDLEKNRLSGSIPVELGTLSNLESLSLYNNRLSGVIPAGTGQPR